MFNRPQPYLALVAAFVMASCGGSDSSTAPSPFQGSFSGNWTSTGSNSGTASVRVTPGGAFSGTEVNTVTTMSGSVAGTLDNNGTFTGTITPQGHGPVNASGQFKISSDRNMLSGSLTYAGVNYTYTLTRLTV